MKNFIGKIIRDNYDKFEEWRCFTNSRKQAKTLTEKVIEKKNSSIVDRKLLKLIKEYSKETFDTPDFWPWLVLYTEVRGKFIEDWIPDDYYSFVMIPKLNPQPVSMLSMIKSYDHRLFPEYALEPLGIKISNNFYTQNQRKITFSEFLEILKEYDDEVVIKRDSGRSGGDIVFKHAREVQFSDFKNGEDYVIQPSIKQHLSLNSLYSHSVNTIRIATLLTKEGTIEVLLKVLRFGRGNSRIDNLVGGGGFISIDDEGRASAWGYDNNGMNIGNRHPDTGFRFKDLQIPSFEKLLNACKQSHLLFPYVSYIAWDVCITNSGEIRFLEWNTRKPAFWCFEATLGPLWKRGWL